MFTMLILFSIVRQPPSVITYLEFYVAQNREREKTQPTMQLQIFTEFDFICVL